jgi:glycolate oxidase FAD binding subunit
MSDSVDNPALGADRVGETTAALTDARPALCPSTIPELLEIVRSTPRLIAIGAGTKPRLSAVECPKVSTAKLSGITEYDPSEYTFTALAGTPLAEIKSALKQRGQYLPFDPPLVAAGATLGGMVAAGLSGSRRFRFGGIRDFILGVKFIDGSGKLLRMGGKVVKNAAGFDLPKFFVGSLGRLGVLVQATFKVFPEPRNWLTLKLEAPDYDDAAAILIQAANSRWEPYAIDYLPKLNAVLLQLGGPPTALDILAAEILAKWKGTKLSDEEAEAEWNDLKEFRWAHRDGDLVKVPLTPKTLVQFCSVLRKEANDAGAWVSAGGNVAFVSLPLSRPPVTRSGSPAVTDTVNGAQQARALDQILATLGLVGMTIRGSGPLWLGKHSEPNIDMAVKRALDPVGRFPALTE